MKRFGLFVFILVLCLSLCACVEKPTTAPSTQAATSTETGAATEDDLLTDDFVEEHVHKYTKTVIDPDCANDGYTLHTCDCGDTYTSDVVAAAGHTWLDATCTEPMSCAICGATEGAAAGHSYSEGKCTECGKDETK